MNFNTRSTPLFSSLRRARHVDGGRFFDVRGRLSQIKNTSVILAKNIALFSISCVMYLVCGYAVMYGGGIFLSGIELDGAASAEALTASVIAESTSEGFDGGSIYADASDFFFQVVFVATAMSIISGSVAERMKLWAFFALQ